MLKKILTGLLAVAALLVTAAAFAAADVNKATEAELDGVRGIGPAMSKRILDERKKGNFKDWGDLIDRVKGVGPANAERFSKEGLTVNGEAFKSTTAKPADKMADKKTEAAKK